VPALCKRRSRALIVASIYVRQRPDRARRHCARVSPATPGQPPADLRFIEPNGAAPNCLSQ